MQWGRYLWVLHETSCTYVTPLITLQNHKIIFFIKPLAHLVVLSTFEKNSNICSKCICRCKCQLHIWWKIHILIQDHTLTLSAFLCGRTLTCHTHDCVLAWYKNTTFGIMPNLVQEICCFQTKLVRLFCPLIVSVKDTKDFVSAAETSPSKWH